MVEMVRDMSLDTKTIEFPSFMRWHDVERNKDIKVPVMKTGNQAYIESGFSGWKDYIYTQLINQSFSLADLSPDNSFGFWTSELAITEKHYTHGLWEVYLKKEVTQVQVNTSQGIPKGKSTAVRTPFDKFNVTIRVYYNDFEHRYTPVFGLTTSAFIGGNSGDWIPVVLCHCNPENISSDYDYGTDKDFITRYLGFLTTQPYYNPKYWEEDEFTTYLGDVLLQNGHNWVQSDDFTMLKEESPQGTPSDEDPDRGGDGKGTRPDEDITDNVLPDEMVIDCDLVTMYNPTKSMVRNISAWLWSSDFFDNVKKNFASPMENIISFHSIPIPLSSTPKAFYCGGIRPIDSFNVPVLTKQFYNVSMGSVTIPKYFGSALDLSPYVNINLYLPFIGIVPLSPDDYFNGTISVDYNIDAYSGTCVARVMLSGNRNKILGQYKGNCATQFPISGKDYSAMYGNVIGSALGLGGSVATGNVGGAVMNALQMTQAKPQYQYSNGLANVSGLDVNYPYLIIHSPVQSLPRNYGEFIGYPSNITVNALSEVTGYTEIETIHLDGIGCTQDELLEIETLLQNGVIL